MKSQFLLPLSTQPAADLLVLQCKNMSVKTLRHLHAMKIRDSLL